MPAPTPATQQQELLAEALSGAANAAFITDQQGTIVWVNRAFSEFYGHQPADAIGQTPRLLGSGKHGPRYYEALWAAIGNGRPWSGVTVDRAASGELLTVRQTITPLRRDGRVTHFLSIHSDISAEAAAASIADLRRETDAISGMHTRDAFEAHCAQRLERARVRRQQLDFVLFAIEHRCGGALHFDAQGGSFVRGVVGERLRRALGRDTVIGGLDDGFDFAALLSGPEATIDALRIKADQVIREPMPLLGDTLTLVCRSAVARFPQDGATLDELRLAADRSLQQQSGPRIGPAPKRAPDGGDMAVERE